MLKAETYYILIAMFLFSCVVQAQAFPVNVAPQIIPPYSLKLSEYNTASSDKLILNLLLTDITETNRQVRLKFFVENNAGLSIQSSDVVMGANPIFLDGGLPLRLTNIDLQPYFALQNLRGINPQQYSVPLPEGLYRFCFEVYDAQSGQQISRKSCATVYLILNDPPFLNLPNRGEQVLMRDPQNIIFQWTPRHLNATNVAYEFTLAELWSHQMDPQAAFLASRPLYQTNTFATTLLYGPAETPLLPDKTYGWRVRAMVSDGISETSIFKNNGYSEIYYFTYTGKCAEPEYVLAEAKNTTSEKILWQGVDHLRYNVQYRKKSTENVVWFEGGTLNEYTTIYNLEPGTAYEFRVGGQCMDNGPFTYSQIYEFTTILADEKESTYNCGITPEIIITNQDPLESLVTNDVFTAGDFPVTVKEVKGAQGSFSGWGYIVVPYLQDTKLKVSFNNISINTDYQLLDGIVVTDYDENWGEMSSVNEVGEVFEGDNDLEAVQLDFDITIDDIKVNDDGTITVTDPVTGAVTKHPSGDDVVIVDSDGDVYHVDENGHVTQGEPMADGGGVNPQNTPGVDENGHVSELSEKGIKVAFISDKSYIYGYDVFPNGQESQLGEYYEQIKDANGETYAIINKAVENGATDVIKGIVDITDSTISIEDLVIKTASGERVNYKVVPGKNEIIVDLKGYYSFEHENIYATIQPKDDAEKQTIAGVFSLWHLSKKDINVTVIPVDGVSLPSTSDLASKINTIFGKASVHINLTIASDFKVDASLYGGDTIEMGESGFYSNYTQDQGAIIHAYKSKETTSVRSYYLFVFGNNIQPSRSGVAGFMPIKRQFGFIFNGNLSKEEEGKDNLAGTISHELGHGVFGLEHPFTELKTSKGATNWLMDYGNGVELSHLDWTQIHNPDFKLYLFQDDEEGEYTDTEFLDKTFQIIRCAYINSGFDEVLSFDTSVFGKTGTFQTKWKGDEIWIKIDKGSFEGMASSEPVEIGKNKKDEIWRHSLKYNDVEIYTPRYSTGADPVELQRIRKHLFPEDKSQFKKEADAILTEVLNKSEFTDEDFQKLKGIANCGVQYFTAKQRYLIISKIVKNESITESYEDLILDLIETVPLNNVEDFYNEFLGYFLEKDAEVLEELFTDIDDAGIGVLWKGRENNFTRFVNALAGITSKLSHDVKKWEIVNYIINNDYGDLEDVEKKGIAKVLSSMVENLEIVDDVTAISELFVEMLVDDCEVLKDYKIVFDIAKIRNFNRELFASFTQSESTVLMENKKVRAKVEVGMKKFSWVTPVVFILDEIYKDEREIKESELSNFYAWSKFLNEDKNKYIVDLLDTNSQKYFQILLEQASKHLESTQGDNDSFWNSLKTIDCDNREVIVHHINAKENTASLKEVAFGKKMKLLEKMFTCNWFGVSDTEAVFKNTEDALIKLVTSFKSTSPKVLIGIEENIGLDKIYDKLSGERLNKFLVWMGSQIISSNYQKPLRRKDFFNNDNVTLKDKEGLLALEADLFNFKNFSIDKIGKKTIKITPEGEALHYSQMIPVYVESSFIFWGEKFKKGSVLQIPLIQAFAMSNSNRNIVLEKGAWVTVDVVSLAVGVGSIKIMFSVGNAVRKAVVVSDLLGSTAGLLANALNEDAVSEETRFQLNMLSLIASVPLLATSSKKIDDMITALDDEISNTAGLNNASKQILEEHIEHIKKGINYNVIKQSDLEVRVDNILAKIKKNNPNCK